MGVSDKVAVKTKAAVKGKGKEPVVKPTAAPEHAEKAVAKPVVKTAVVKPAVKAAAVKAAAVKAAVVKAAAKIKDRPKK